MYKINYYRDKNGHNEFEDYFLKLKEKTRTSKDARIKFGVIQRCITYLQRYGTHSLPKECAKLIKDDIWELRPDKHRILYFYFKDDTYVLLHHFIKKTLKTPNREIKKAIKERDEYVREHK